jgi:tRNA threonylcarbamoyladenosine biosynthesis protein TsaE
MTERLTEAHDTEMWGERLAAELTQGDVVLLFGGLGVGKTTLVRGLARGLDCAEIAVSPTYTILEVYQGRLPVFHFDFYRVDSHQDVRATDAREYFDEGITVIEWPERVEAWWPSSRLEITLAHCSGGRTLSRRKVTSDVAGH